MISHGRVKVQFYWDRDGKKDENSSCWVRVSSTWAGKNWGFVQIPRIGQEVIVDFLEGDADLPIITGRVYNAEQTPPYDLPADQTQSGVKSRSSKSGTGENFNEIRMEDKKGSEELYIHAEKDHKQVTENDRTEDVGHDRFLTVGNDKNEEVGNDKRVEVKKNKTTIVGGNHDEKIDKNMTLSVKENRDVTVGKDLSTDVDGSISLNVKKDSAVSVGKNHGLSVDKKITVKAGDSISIESDKEIFLKTGSASLLMKKNGDIIIKGGKIQVKGSKDVILKGSKIAEN
jgi:type VI secretion system secreted protein VgrG